MNILITGAKGFVGKNLVTNLMNIKENKNRTRPNLKIDEIYSYDIDSSLDELEEYVKKSDFIFHLAGVNRPKNHNEFKEGNLGFTKLLLNSLKKTKSKAPIMLSSTIQASLMGRYNNDYGKSKKETEELLLEYHKQENIPVYIYRFPNLFGKWCKPNYNSVIATFCYNIANDLPIRVDDPSTKLELLYIDDLVEEMFNLLEGKVKHCEYQGLNKIENSTGRYCYIDKTHKVTLGEIVTYLNEFKEEPNTLIIPSIPNDSFKKKLYSTYLSYLPISKITYSLKMNQDDRGSFTELFKTLEHGQVSINIMKPGIKKGEHYHNSKWEFFIVVSGHGLIKQRKIDTNEVLEFEVSGEELKAIHILPGYTHNIINLSNHENLVTVMWANEIFDPNHPDTYMEEVENE